MDAGVWGEQGSAVDKKLEIAILYELNIHTE
jgi:hypothetical protein